VNKAVDTTVQTNEDSEIGDGLDGARNFVALVERLAEFFPWVLLTLLNAQRYTTTYRTDVCSQDNDELDQPMDLHPVASSQAIRGYDHDRI